MPGHLPRTNGQVTWNQTGNQLKARQYGQPAYAVGANAGWVDGVTEVVPELVELEVTVPNLKPAPR